MLVISEACDAAVGDRGSERFFRSAAATDDARRARSCEVRVGPSASATHVGGGSGQSLELIAVMLLNRYREFETAHGRLASLASRVELALSHLVRLGDVRHRTALRYLISGRSWSELPAGTSPIPAPRGDSQPVGRNRP